MNYKGHYSRLIERARTRALLCYSERHHVIPKCIGGTNDRHNVVFLTPEEHYVAHQLLVKIYPGNHRLLWAAVAMTNKTKSMSRNNKLYGWLRRQLADRMSIRHTGRKVSDESRLKMSASRLGVKRGPHSAEHRRKMSIAAKGKPKSPEHCAAMSASKSGKKKWPHNAAWKHNQSIGIRRALANGAKRPDQTAPVVRARQAESMRNIWIKRRAGELPSPKHASKVKGG